MHERIAQFGWQRRSAHSPDDLPEVFDRLASIGFDTLLIDDLDRGPDDTLRTVADACRVRGLALWAVVVPDAEGLPVFDADASPTIDPWMVDGDVALIRVDLRRRSAPARSPEVRRCSPPGWRSSKRLPRAASPASCVETRTACRPGTGAR